jgi:hypothetical protein
LGSIFKILTFDFVEYVTTPPEKKSEAPDSETNADDNCPPVQLSATEIDKFESLIFLIKSCLLSNLFNI